MGILSNIIGGAVSGAPGGPIGAVIGGIIGALGKVDNPAAKVAVDALTSFQGAVSSGAVTPEQLAEANRHTEAMAVNETAKDRIAADDRASARQRAVEMRDWTPQIIGFALIFVWTYVNVHMLNGEWKPSISGEMVGRILGYLDASLGGFILWLYGSTRQSAAKDQTISNMSGGK